MANTIMSAKNSFELGLIMDFSPDNTQANCLTSALNATLLTFNGNEMLLQNDMGNGRVETAFLPEGYIPIGTCEFGDIVYIVSYNPLINKSLIGCFPSPERNISSEEIGNLLLKLSWKDFQEGGEAPNGKLKASSVKKIIFEKPLNPGDKYFAYIKHNSNDPLVSNQNTITDVGNSLHLYGDYPKLLRIHLVAIEDGGKINYLDNTVKWYGNEGTEYFLQSLKLVEALTPDLDSYRTIVSDAYTVFLSKVSGKLAILAELEKITGFSCTHSVHTLDNFDENKRYENTNYLVYLHTSWTTDNPDINPSGYVILESEFNNPDKIIGEPENFNFTGSTPYIDYGNIYSRHYLLESPAKYEDYVTLYSYTALKKYFIDKFSYNNDSNYIPSKITRIRKKDGYTTEFMYNAFNYDTLGYYFSDNQGNKRYISKESEYYFDLSLKLKEPELKQEQLIYSDTFIHSYFNTDIIKPFYNIKMSKYMEGSDESNLEGVIHKYTVCPAMPYGYLEEYKITNIIDFNKVGTGAININEWRYYNDENVATLTFGIEAYPEEGKGISKVLLEFYDNNGLTGSIEIKDRNSYSGTFTEVIALNQESQLRPNTEGHKGASLNLDGVKFTVNTDTGLREVELSILDIKDKAETITDNIELVDDLTSLAYMYKNNIILNEGENLYLSDAGILYSNWLYLVKIKVYYLNYNSLGTFDDSDVADVKEFDRWFWTNNMWNEYYTSIYDYSVLQPDISIQIDGGFEETSGLKVDLNENTSNLNYDPNNKEESLQKQTLGYNKYQISSIGDSNLTLTIFPRIANNYGTFALNGSVLKEEENSLLSYNIYEGNSIIDVSVPDKILPEGITYVDNINLLNPIIQDSSSELSDLFSLTSQNINNNEIKDVEYTGISGERLTTTGYKRYNKTSGILYKEIGETINLVGIPLKLEGTFYSKIMFGNSKNVNLECPKYYPILRDLDNSLADNNLIKVSTGGPNGNYFAFKYLCNLHTKKYGGLYVSLIETLSSGYLNAILEQNLIPEENKRKSSSNLKNELKKISINSDMNGYFLPITYVKQYWDDDFKNEKVILSEKILKDVSINSSWVQLWGAYKDGYNNYSIITWSNSFCDETGLKGERGSSEIMQLAVKDYMEDWVPINAISRLYRKDNDGYSLQLFGKASTTGVNIQKGFKSMAQIIASLLSLIYIKSTELHQEPKTIPYNPIINNNYEEIWKKDFVFKPVLNSTLENAVNKLISIRGMSFNEYKELLAANAKANVDVPNLNFKFNETTSLLLFLHSCKYNINLLLNEYSNFETNLNNYIYITNHISEKPGGKLIKRYDSDVLYLDLNNKTVLTSPDNILLYPFTIDGVVDYSNSISMSDFILSQLLRVRDGKLMLSPPEGASSVGFSIPSADDDNEWTHVSFNRNLKLKNFDV